MNKMKLYYACFLICLLAGLTIVLTHTLSSPSKTQAGGTDPERKSAACPRPKQRLRAHIEKNAKAHSGQPASSRECLLNVKPTIVPAHHARS